MPSFDVVSKINMQEVDNAINSVNRELSSRYDFKGLKFSIELDQKENLIKISAPDSYKITAIRDSLKTHGVKRGIDAKAFDFQKEEVASGNSVRQEVKLKNGIDQEVAKEINRQIKDKKLKINSSIRGDEVRVEGKNKDDLQQIMSMLKSNDYKLPLQFINFRD